jgi:hypothetical protein
MENKIKTKEIPEDPKIKKNQNTKISIISIMRKKL